MALKLYNTLSRKKEIFKPLEDKKVGLYACGPTVYWFAHVGNLRTYVFEDILKRVLQYNGYNVKHVINITDVGHLTSDADTGEDKIEKGAKREGLSPQKIADKYIKIFESDIRDLNVLPPKFKPRATEIIPEIIAMIKILLKKGFAYATPLAIYFDASKAKNYNELSGQKMDEKMKGAGKADVSDSDKKNPADFALWFFKAGKHKNALQIWRSPFLSPLVKNGEGFPGWHIECSAMIKKFLAKTIDIHIGGIEHIPVHHTNEIAQAYGAFGQQTANYWLHNGWLALKNEKMSKSLGNIILVTDLLEKNCDPLALRYLILTSHYRQGLTFTWEALKSAEISLEKLRELINSWWTSEGRKTLTEEDLEKREKFKKDFLRLLNQLL